MLEHEPHTQATHVSTPITPASERRVSPEELTAALTALDANKQLAAKQLAETVPIGQVISEMGLEATPEEIWAQVLEQRRQKADGEKSAEEARQMPFEQAAKQTYRRAAWKVAPPGPLPLQRRLPLPLLRRLSKIKGWVWIVFWCTGGFGLLAGLPHLLDHRIHANPGGDSIIVSGDGQTLTTNPDGKLVEVGGDGDVVVLTGNSRWLIVNGDHNTIRVKGKIDRLTTGGDKNTIILPAGPSPIVTGEGDGNKVEQGIP